MPVALLYICFEFVSKGSVAEFCMTSVKEIDVKTNISFQKST
jgi:hypothetical protein